MSYNAGMKVVVWYGDGPPARDRYYIPDTSGVLIKKSTTSGMWYLMEESGREVTVFSWEILPYNEKFFIAELFNFSKL